MFWTNLMLLIKLRWEKFNIFLEGLVFDEFTNIKKQRERNEKRIIDAVAEEVEEDKVKALSNTYEVDNTYNYTTDTMHKLLTDRAHIEKSATDLWIGKYNSVVKTVESDTKDKNLSGRVAGDMFMDLKNVRPIGDTWDDSIRGGYGNRELFSFKVAEYDNRILNDEYFTMQSGSILRVITREHPLGDKSSCESTYQVENGSIIFTMYFDMPDLFNPDTGEYDIGERQKVFTQSFSIESIFLLRGNDIDYIKKQLGYNMPYEVFHSTGTGLIGCDLLIETYAEPKYNLTSIAELNMPLLKKLPICPDSVKDEIVVDSYIAQIETIQVIQKSKELRTKFEELTNDINR